jgi:hypothetical protein
MGFEESKDGRDGKDGESKGTQPVIGLIGMGDVREVLVWSVLLFYYFCVLEVCCVRFVTRLRPRLVVYVRNIRIPRFVITLSFCET